MGDYSTEAVCAKLKRNGSIAVRTEKAKYLNVVSVGGAAGGWKRSAD
jgi:hypothetical protein